VSFLGNLVEGHIILKDLHEEVEGVALDELLLEADCHLAVCFCV